MTCGITGPRPQAQTLQDRFSIFLIEVPNPIHLVRWKLGADSAFVNLAHPRNGIVRPILKPVTGCADATRSAGHSGHLSVSSGRLLNRATVRTLWTADTPTPSDQHPSARGLRAWCPGPNGYHRK